MANPNNDVSARINNLFERGAIALLGMVLAMTVWTYQGHLADFKALQTQVMTLQMDKVSKEDLREVEARINNNFDARVNELIARSQSDKADILSRLDLYFKQQK